MQQLPENVRDWLYSGELAELETRFEEFLRPEELHPVHELTMNVYLREVNLAEFVAQIQEIVPGVRGQELAKSILGYELIRVEDWFADDVETVLRSLGGHPLDYKNLLNGDEAIEEAVRGVNVELIPTRTRDAIFGKMQEYLNGALDKASLLEAMMKSPKIGGWGWDQDIALPVVEKLEKHLREAEEKHAAFVSKEKFAEIEARKAEARKLLEAEFLNAKNTRSFAAAQDDKKVVIPKPRDQVIVEDLPPLPDPFAFAIRENLPHLADSELNIAPLADPFAELFKELEREQLQPVPEPAFAYADVHEHRGLVETEAPKTPFERALHASDILLEHELLEIEHRKEELMKDVPETAIVVSSTLEALVDRIMIDCEFESKDASLVKRVRNIVSSRLRDIRGSEETAKLLSKISQGQRDLTREMVEKIVMLTEQAFLEFQRKVIERGMQRERSQRVRMREEVLEQKREDVFQDEKELNERFKKLTGKSMKIELPKPSMEDANRAALGTLKDSGDRSAVPVAPKPVSVATAPDRKVQVTVSAKSMMPTKQANGDPIADVKYQRQLAGPVEELRMMRLTDFRRLSKDPKAATEKIMAKIELLGADGYEKKMQGVMAWRESPIMKLYMAVTKQALDDATPLTAVLDKKRKDIPEMLTIQECQAMRELNTKLRY